MGFSQGASMASLLQLLLERPYLSPIMAGCKHEPLKFSIIVSGFEPRDQETLKWYTNKYSVLQTPKDGTHQANDGEDLEMEDQENKENVEPPSLHGVQGASMHVMGRTDVIIEPGKYIYP
jgi:hypothetical protein